MKRENLLWTVAILLLATILSSSSCGTKEPPVKTCWNGTVIPENQACPPQTKTCWNGQQIPISQECPVQDLCPSCSKWMTATPILTAPVNTGQINPGEAKSAGTFSVANSSSANHTANLTFTFGGAGAAAVDSIIFVTGGMTYPKKLVNNSFTFEGVSVAANSATSINVSYRIASTIPAGVVDQSQITLALSAIATDETGVTQPGTKTLPATINLDRVKVPKLSTWLAAPTVTYGQQFAIIGNACSSPLTIKVNNTSGSVKTGITLNANFGAYGQAVKMLRYKLNGGDWTVIPAIAGEVSFQNLTLQPGENVFDCIFALRVAPGVQDGSALAFQFTSADEGSGQVFPVSGSFAPAVAVGTVNSATQATRITTEWESQMIKPGLILDIGSDIRPIFHVVTRLRATGPGNAKFVSIKLKNPYTAFDKLVFDNNAWALTINGAPDKSVSNYIWQGEYITLTLPNESVIISDGISYNIYYVKCSFQNVSSTHIFYSDVYTPGYRGFMLTSKYDIVVHNSDGQMIDLSDVVVKQDYVELLK